MKALARGGRVSGHVTSAATARAWRLFKRQPVANTIGALAITAGLTLSVYSAVELARFARVEVRRHTVIYASGQSLSPGTQVRLIDLAGSLSRLGYAESRSPALASGQFRRSAGAWDIALRGQAETQAPAGVRVRLTMTGDRIARVTRDGVDVEAVALESEVLGGGSDRPDEEYRPLRLSETPKVLIDAVLAAEDRRFFEHGPLDLPSLMRAAWTNLRAGRVAQGGSTITQQLVKSRLLNPRRTALRKVEEAWLALLVECRYSKRQILEAYLNEVYLGQRGPIVIRGMGAAARTYFGKEAHQLTAGEAALLAGMLRAPNSYSPALSPARARERRDLVLARMRDVGMLTTPEYQRARAEAVRAPNSTASGQGAPYFADAVRQELEQRFDESPLRDEEGLHIVTTLDPTLQRFAESAVARGLDGLETRVRRLHRPRASARLQAALVVLDPATGEIRALVGGRDYATSQFNRALMAHRQPGSAFKPFVYAAALIPKNGRTRFTAASIVDDSPMTVVVSGRSWTPRNYEDRYEGPVTLRRALEQSLNGATVRVAQTVGLARVVATARALGFGDNLEAVPAVALGTFEVTPLELARAYIPFANAGRRPGGTAAVRAVYERDGAQVPPIEEEAPAQVITPAEAYVMTSLLQGVIRSGTGAAARALGVPGDVAGKTGTTNEGRDAWFVGYSPTLLAVVWVGFDDAQPLGLSGAEAALPIWADFMRQALAAYPSRSFAVPDGVTFVDIDTTNGKRANAFCRLVAREAFLTGTEPGPCEEHGVFATHVTEWWGRVLGWFRH